MTDIHFSSLFKVGTHGIPIYLIETQYFYQWLEARSPHQGNWLRSTCYQGEGLSLIPAPDGKLGEVVFGVKDLKNYFACGDLVSQLPPGEYRVKDSDVPLDRVAFSWGVGAYTFDRYKTNAKPTPQLLLPSETLMERVERDVSAITLVRDLINTPAADMMPQDLSDAVDTLAEKYGAETHHIIGDELLEKNYPAIHMVGRASVNQPRLIDLRWGYPNHPKVTLVGKGVCFDSGGLDIKTTASMRRMKKDMGGAAHVMGLAQLIMSHQLPVCLRLLIPAVENAIAGNAFRPGDVITTRQGLTVEVDNTDAEGRLILCDTLAEADTERPDLLIDFATLTSACRVALGTELPGFFSNNRSLASEIVEISESIDDPTWNLPMYEPYRDSLTSDVADLSNCGSTGDLGAAITAALYLQEFVSPDTDWLHFDVMGWNLRALPGRPVGGEAVGIRALFKYISIRYS